MEIDEIYKLYRKYPFIKTDTRKLRQGDIFFALKGPHFNGNDFTKTALDAGAAYVFTDEEINLTDDRIIKTIDSLATLQMLAKYHRDQFNIPFIGITGSNGKTTTKELAHHVLASTFKTYTTEGNLNNHIGIPLTILKINADAEMAVIEMGANHQKEIEQYCKYSNPTHGLITNCGKAHLEGFGSIEGVRKSKGELFDYLRETNGTAFVNSTDEFIIAMAKGINSVSYGTHGSYISGIVKNSSSFLEATVLINEKPVEIKTQLVGEYNLLNVLAAVTIGNFFKIPVEKIKNAIENYKPSNSRSQLIKQGTNEIIFDAYNANPNSMKAAIQNFAKMERNNKILLLGNMMELGKESEQEHIEIIKIIDQYEWDKVALVGKEFKNIDHSFLSFDSVLQLRDWFKEQQFQNKQILIKGSRSTQMEKVLE